MEIISIAGYITDEKMHIARDYLEKNTREASGIKPELVEVTDDALLALIENYCREAGVRNLQKHIEKIYRKIALKLVRQGVSNEPPRDITIVEANEELAGFDVAIKVEDENYKNSLVKDVSVDVNPVDSSLENINAVPLTTESEVGHNEHSNEAPIEKFLEETAKVFNTSSAPEVKEKTIAARRSGVKMIIFPSANRRDFDELASNVKEGLQVHFVDTYNEIYDIAFASDARTQES